MNKAILSVFLVLLLSCNPRTEATNVNSTNPKELNATTDFSIALKFVNDYAEYCAPSNQKRDERTWIDKNPLLTINFKNKYKNILDSALKKDPELGLGFDPIFDAQDFPDKGFSIFAADTSSGYVTVVGNDWKEFKLVLKMVNEDNKWLVDGAGIINVPTDKRAAR